MSATDSTIQRLHKAIQQILLLRLNHTEIACLKTLTLFRHGELDMLCLQFRVVKKLLRGRSLIITKHMNRASCCLHSIHLIYSLCPIHLILLLCRNRLCWSNVAIRDCRAPRRFVELINRIMRQQYSNGTYFINIAVYSFSSRSKDYPGKLLTGD